MTYQINLNAILDIHSVFKQNNGGHELNIYLIQTGVLHDSVFRLLLYFNYTIDISTLLYVDTTTFAGNIPVFRKKNPQQYCQTPRGVVNEKYHDVNRRKIEIHEDKSSFANCRIVLTRNIIMNGVEVFHH